MALVICWYDIVCLGLVAASLVVSFWVLWRRELASKCDDNIIYQSLLVARPDINDRTVVAMPGNHVGSSQLWTSCWKAVHPGWLLATRFISFLVMAGLLWRDIVEWDATIFIYYTEDGPEGALPAEVGNFDEYKKFWFCGHPLLIYHLKWSTLKTRTSLGGILYPSMSNTSEGLGYWLRWQVPVCALAIICPSLLSFYVIKKAKTEPLYIHELWKSRWRCLNPLWLLVYRFFALLCLSPMLYRIVSLDGAFAFYFYTQWTFMLIMIYFALGTVMSAYGCWVSFKQPAVSEHGEKSVFLKRDVEEDGTATSITYKENKSEGTVKLRSHCAEEAIRERAGFWGYLMQIIYQTCAGAVILTDIIFWCVIVPFLSNSHLGLNVLMGCMHSLNAVFLVIDTALNSLPFPWFRLAYFVQWSCLYVIFQWVIHACGFTWWPYPFLELNTPWAPLWYFAMAAIHIPCYGIYALIFKAKNSFFPRLFPRAFVRSY